MSGSPTVGVSRAEQALADDSGRFSVAVFCGSRVGTDPAHAAAAWELGAAIGQRGWRLVYGGGDVGLMGVTARSALAAGAAVLGIIPQRLLDREAGKLDLSELRITTPCSIASSS